MGVPVIRAVLDDIANFHFLKDSLMAIMDAFQGGRPVRIPDPPSPLETPPPKFSNSSFSNLRFWGKGSAPKTPKIFFLPFLRGYFFFTLCVYTQNTQNLMENSKMFEKHRKFP